MKTLRVFIQQCSDIAEDTVGFQFKTEGFGRSEDPCFMEAVKAHVILTGQKKKVLTASPAISRLAQFNAG